MSRVAPGRAERTRVAVQASGFASATRRSQNCSASRSGRSTSARCCGSSSDKPIDALPNPVEEELCRFSPDAGWLSVDLHIERTGAGNAVRVGNIRSRTQQKPAALPNGQFTRQFDRFDAAVSHEFHGGDRIARVEITVERNLNRSGTAKDVPRQLPICSHAQQWSIRDKHASRS